MNGTTLQLDGNVSAVTSERLTIELPKHIKMLTQKQLNAIMNCNEDKQNCVIAAGRNPDDESVIDFVTGVGAVCSFECTKACMPLHGDIEVAEDGKSIIATFAGIKYEVAARWLIKRYKLLLVKNG